METAVADSGVAVGQTRMVLLALSLSATATPIAFVFVFFILQ